MVVQFLDSNMVDLHNPVLYIEHSRCTVQLVFRYRLGKLLQRVEQNENEDANNPLQEVEIN